MFINLYQLYKHRAFTADESDLCGFIFLTQRKPMDCKDENSLFYTFNSILYRVEMIESLDILTL